MSYLNKICCSDHPYATLIEDYGYATCPECGLVVEDRPINESSEWRNFSNQVKNATKNKDMSRVGDIVNPFLGGTDLSTVIEENHRKTSRKPDGFSKHNRRTMSNTNRVLKNAFEDITSMCDRINITTDIKEAANVLFKKVYESKKMRGHKNDAITAACLLIACREKKAPRSFKEIVAISGVSEKHIYKTLKKIRWSVKIKVKHQIYNFNTSDYADRFCGKLGLPFKLRKVAKMVAKNATEKNLVQNRTPLSVLATAIFLVAQASGHQITEQQVGNVTGVAESTIRATYREIVPHTRQLFPANFNFAISFDKVAKSTNGAA